MKIEETDPVTRKKLAPRRIYVCIKRLKHNRIQSLYEEKMNALVQELVTASCLKGSKYVLEVKEFVKTDNNFSIVM